MTGFDLLSNFNPNPERIGRIMRRCIVPPQKRLTLPISLPSTLAVSFMAQKSLRQFSAPSSSHIPTRLNQDQAGNDGFELKTGLVNMVQASPFCGKASEDANAHLQNFMEVSNTINPKGTTMDIVCLRLSRSHCLGKTRRGFTATRKLSRHGKLVQMHSWPNTSRWARQMPFGTESPVPNNYRMRLSQRPGSVYRSTSKHAHTMAWKNG